MDREKKREQGNFIFLYLLLLLLLASRDGVNILRLRLVTPIMLQKGKEMNYKEILDLCLERRKGTRDEEGKEREREKGQKKRKRVFVTEGIKGVAKGNGLPVALR